MHKLTFEDHRRSLNSNRYIYAVISRRAQGLSIGINLNPDKSCNFDCPYCQVDRTIPGGKRRVDVDVLSQELCHLFDLIREGTLWGIPPFDTASIEYQVVRDVSFAGDGEPCSSPQFQEAIACVGAICQQYAFSDVKYQLLTNATLFHKQHVREGLMRFWHDGGMIWAKLDAGTQEWFSRVDGTRLPLQKILDNILWAGQQQPITLQCMFHRFGEERPSLYEQEQWALRIRHLLANGAQIALVQIYSTARKPSQPDIFPLTRDELEEIASMARRILTPFVDASLIQVY